MIPDGWKSGKINELNHYITSGSRGWAQYYSDSGDLFVRITNLTREKLSLDLSDSKYVEIPKDNNEGKRTRLMKDDILISITADLGIIGFIENEFDKPAYINQHVALLRIDEKGIDNRFIAYQMASESGHQQFISLNDAGAKSGLNLDSIRRFSILIPPLLEQCKIVEMLGVWDESIDLLERLIGRVRSRKQGLMQQLLTGKKRFKEFEDSEWRTVKLIEVAEVIVSPVDKLTVEGEISVLLCNYTHVYHNNRITNALNFMKATATEKEIAKFTLSKGDVIITKDSETPNDIAVPSYVSEDLGNVVCGYHLSILRPRKNEIDGEYLSYLLSTAEIRYYFFTLANGATRFGLSVGSIEKAQFNLPSLPEQEKIAAVLSAADEEISTLEKQLAAYKQQKLGLMQQLLTGKIRVG
jgi:type I restriction enzyme, S subunit